MTTRRTFLAGGAAALMVPGGPMAAQTGGWGGVVDAARALTRCAP